MKVLNIKSLLIIAVMYLSFAAPSQAFVLQISPASNATTMLVGQSFVVTGQITNTTGNDLWATDIFFSFSGYDPSFIQVEQLLGLEDFALPDRTISGEVDLFRIFAIGQPGSLTPLPVDFFAMDVNGIITESSTFNVVIDVDSPVGVPEPAALSLLLLGIFALFSATRGRRRSVRETIF